MRTIIPVLLLAFAAYSLVLNLRILNESGSASELKRMLVIHIMMASWFLVGLIAQLQGGTALRGDVDGSRFFLRHNPNSVLVDVSPLHWIISLAFESFTTGLWPLVVAWIIHSSEPVNARWAGTKAFVWFGALWAAAIGLRAISGFVRWAGAVS